MKKGTGRRTSRDGPFLRAWPNLAFDSTSVRPFTTNLDASGPLASFLFHGPRVQRIAQGFTYEVRRDERDEQEKTWKEQ